MKRVVVSELFAIAGFLAAAGCLLGWLLTQKKLTETQTSQRTLEGSSRILEEERHVLELIARDASLTEVLDALTAAIERMVPESICSILLVNKEHGSLEQASAPHLPAEYWNLCKDLPIKENLGSCPSAAYCNQTVVVEDISKDFRWAVIKDIALRFDLKSCWSVPIRDSHTQEVIGTFAMYHRYVSRPSRLELSIVHAGAHLAASAIERLRSRRRLLDYKSRFELAEKAASLGIWEWDPVSRIFELSEGAAAISGFPEKDCRLTMEQLHASVHPEDTPKLNSAFQRLISEGGVYEVEYRRILPDGTVRWFRNHSSAQSSDGAAQRIVGAVLEITEQKELLLNLEKAKEAAEDALRAKSQFLANMSHEIRTPMNAVLGMTNLLLDLELPHEAKDYVNTIRTSSDSLLSIINDILDFSKIESGKLDLEHIPISLHECLEEAAELLAPRCAEKGLDIAVDIDPALGEWVYGDSTRLRQVVVNLIGNAVKFTEKGSVLIRAHKVSGFDGAKQIHIQVQDTGIGIEIDKINRLFQSFTQVDASTTRKFGGTGLGLAISKRLTELLGGRMWVESEPGVGSTFQFTLPYEPAPAQKFPPVIPKDWAGKRVLVVDGNTTNLKVVVAYLTQWKLASEAVTSAFAAMDALRTQKYDLLIVEWQMPDISGAEFGNAVKAEFGSAAPPLVMLSSGASLAREAFRDRENPFAAVVTKPIRRQLLHRTLLKVLSGIQERSTSTKALEGDLAKRAPLRILLADDNLVNQKVASRLLERWGYRPDVVSNGLEVLEALHRQRYDIVLLDVQMPEMDGLEAARRICSEWDSGRRPFLTALTAGAMKEDRDRCFAAGMDAYLSKPLNVQELQAALENCYAGLKARNSFLHLNQQLTNPELITR